MNSPRKERSHVLAPLFYGLTLSYLRELLVVFVSLPSDDYTTVCDFIGFEMQMMKEIGTYMQEHFRNQMRLVQNNHNDVSQTWA